MNEQYNAKDLFKEDLFKEDLYLRSFISKGISIINRKFAGKIIKIIISGKVICKELGNFWRYIYYKHYLLQNRIII